MKNILHIFWFIGFCLLSYGGYRQHLRIVALESNSVSEYVPEATSVDDPNQLVSEAGLNSAEITALVLETLEKNTKIVTPTISTKTTNQPTSTFLKTAYIPLSTSFTATSTEWIDVADSGVYIDLVHEYGKNATVSWEAYLKVAHGNGQAFARLWDDTNKIAVDFSELTTVNNVTSTLVSSKNLPFWNGRNLYKVQVKSLNSFEVTVSGAKIKVQY